MGSRYPSFSEIQTIGEVAQKHRDIERSLRFYYREPGLEFRDAKFIGYTAEQVSQELDDRLDELDRDSALAIFCSLEASFRTDFRVRCTERWKDTLSRRFRDLSKRKGDHVMLEQDILEAWKQHVPKAKPLISEILGALRYRHWLAHGRYWSPKFGRNYDFAFIYLLAQEMELVFQEQSR